MAEECDAPIGDIADAEETAEKFKAAKAGRILKERGDCITIKHREYLEEVLRKFYETDELTEDLINQAAANLHKNFPNEISNLHSYKVFKYYEKNWLGSFDKSMARMVLDSMKPKYLPEYWPVSLDYELLEGKIKESPYLLYSEVSGIYK